MAGLSPMDAVRMFRPWNTHQFRLQRLIYLRKVLSRLKQFLFRMGSHPAGFIAGFPSFGHLAG